ncbi:hypothetical protein ACQEVF_34130 [Nonomuraea polychroma]|uniref:hypothetical protein n=1 Tax=Nonomuraea polychroma TaxID=46176 RepID=UPI003D92D956
MNLVTQAYLDAVRTPQHEDYREIVVGVDGKEAIVGLRKDRPVGVDLVREIHDWAAFKATVRELRAGLWEDA